MFKEFFIVGLGGFLGSGMRYLIGKMAQHIAFAGLPIGTFLANIIGCLLFGFISQHATIEGRISPTMQLMLTTGFCGGFTTFSTFVHENSTFLRENNFLHLSGYLLISLIVGLAAIYLGEWLAK